MQMEQILNSLQILQVLKNKMQYFALTFIILLIISESFSKAENEEVTTKPIKTRFRKKVNFPTN
jgi:hypothetical protein